MSKVYLTSLIALAMMMSTFAVGHHSFAAQFDINRPVKLVGTVTEMRFANPHAWLYISVEQEDGTVVNWALETGRAGNILIRNGWRPKHLPPGTVVHADGWLARNGSNTANIRSVTLPDGTRLFAGTRVDRGS